MIRIGNFNQPPYQWNNNINPNDCRQVLKTFLSDPARVKKLLSTNAEIEFTAFPGNDWTIKNLTEVRLKSFFERNPEKFHFKVDFQNSGDGAYWVTFTIFNPKKRKCGQLYVRARQIEF